MNSSSDPVDADPIMQFFAYDHLPEYLDHSQNSPTRSCLRFRAMRNVPSLCVSYSRAKMPPYARS